MTTLRRLKELTDDLPSPGGPTVKGIVQTTLYIIELAEVSDTLLTISSLI